MENSHDSQQSRAWQVHIGKRREAQWAKDSSCKKCTSCEREFTWKRRKHHCRVCGQIFCQRCCNNKDALRRDVDHFPLKSQRSHANNSLNGSTCVQLAKKTGQYAYQNVQYFYSGNGNNDQQSVKQTNDRSSPLGGSPEKLERTCDECHAQLARERRAESALPELLEQNINEWIGAISSNVENGRVSGNYADSGNNISESRKFAAKTLLRIWRELPLRSRNDGLTQMHCRMLLANAEIAFHHSSWKHYYARLLETSFITDLERQYIQAFFDEDSAKRYKMKNKANVSEQSTLQDYIESGQNLNENDDNSLFLSQCDILMCNKAVCYCGWSVQSCVEIVQDSQIKNMQVLQSCAEFLSRAKVCLVSMFLFNLCDALVLINRKHFILPTLLEHAQTSQKLASEMFWFCMCAVHDEKLTKQKRKFYVDVLRRFEQACPQLWQELYSGKRMLQALDACGNIDAAMDSDNCLSDIVRDPSHFRMPVQAHCRVEKLELQRSKIMKSATKPMMVPCASHDHRDQRFNVLLKREDVRKDTIIINAVRYMRYLLEQKFPEAIVPNMGEGADRDDTALCNEQMFDTAKNHCEDDRFGIVCYECLPTSPDSGVIQMVPRSVTIDKVQNQIDTPLMLYLLSKNKAHNRAILQERFLRSTAAYCIITYLLGIGDRHLDNIMITDDAHLFHIDFGYVIGNDPKKRWIGSPTMRLTEYMVEMLGGSQSAQFERFQQLCTDIYNFLRPHCVTIQLLLSPLVKIGECSSEQLNREIQKRFLPGDSDLKAQVQICNKIEGSRGSQYVPSVVDLMHSGGKHLSSLVTEPVLAVASLLPQNLQQMLKNQDSEHDLSYDEDKNHQPSTSFGNYAVIDREHDLNFSKQTQFGSFENRHASNGAKNRQHYHHHHQIQNHRGSVGRHSSGGGSFSGSFEREKFLLSNGIQERLSSPPQANSSDTLLRKSRQQIQNLEENKMKKDQTADSADSSDDQELQFSTEN